MNCCSQCGYSEHSTHGSTFCPTCGKKLVRASDSRDVCSQERQTAFQELQAAKDRFKATK